MRVTLLLFLLIFSIFLTASYAAEIILDPGHSPKSPGAKSCSGHHEYQYNDLWAENLKFTLASKGLDVDLTRQPHEEKTLIQRAALSKDKKLFVALHHDSVQPQFVKTVNGNPYSTHGSGYSIFVSRKNPYFEESFKYAQMLGRILQQHGLQYARHHAEAVPGENKILLDPIAGVYQYDDLVVLKNSHCPALLLEIGVIVNPEDERKTRTKEYFLPFADAFEKVIKTVLTQNNR